MKVTTTLHHFLPVSSMDPNMLNYYFSQLFHQA